MNRVAPKNHKSLLLKKAILALTAACLLCYMGVGPARADQLELLSKGNIWYHGLYVGPYQVSVNGTATSLICDAFAADMSVGQTWDATLNTWSELQNMKFSGNFGNNATSAAQAYKEMFYLSMQIEKAANSAYIAPIDYALWQITDTHTPAVRGKGSESPTSSAYWLKQAAQNYQTVDTSDFLVYTPNPLNAYQEFILVRNPAPGSVPLPSSALLLATGLVGFVGFRKRRTTGRKG